MLKRQERTDDYQKPLSIVAKLSISDVRMNLGSAYASIRVYRSTF